MIPSVLDPNCSSPGEREIFHRLKDDPATEGWTVLHSLDVAEHRKQISGEIDFVLIIPGKGVLCIEVKACSRLSRDSEGRWFYGSDTKGDPRGPFKQASGSMHSIREYVVKQRPDMGRVVFWSAVVFPYVPFNETSPEWHPWQVIDSRAYRRRSFASLAEHVMDRAREFLAGRPTAAWFHPESDEPYPAQCDALGDILRPHFEFFESPRSSAERRDAEVKHYTTRQIGALDAMAANPRVLFAGPAGSGKTLLAIESVRRAANQGKSVLFVCFNHLLGRWLQDQVSPLGSAVWAGTLHRRMSVATGSAPPGGADEQYWTTDLPALAIEMLLDSDLDGVAFDELVVDEAQDLLRDSYLDFLDLSLKGGLAAGKWRMFGDFEKQAIYGAAYLDVKTGLEPRAGSVFSYSLRENCRNTPRIAACTRILGGLGIDYASVIRPDDGVEPELRYYRTHKDQVALLIETLEHLYADGFRGRDIVVLSPKATGCASLVTQNPWSGRLRPLETAHEGEIGYVTVHAFKGLESPAIVVTDVEQIRDPAAQALFYVATTRPLHRLVILANESLKPDVREAIAKSLRGS